MSANNHHIDNQIKKKLDGHKAKAPEEAWSRLNAELHAPARTRFFWLSRAAAAVILLLIAFGAGYYFSEFNRIDNGNLAENNQPENLTGESTRPVSISQDLDNIQSSESPGTELQPASSAEDQTYQGNVDNVQFTQPENVITQIEDTESSLVVENVPEDNFTTDDPSGADKLHDENVTPIEIKEADKAVALQQEVENPAPEEQKTSIPQDEVPVMSDEMLREMLLTGQDDLAEGMFGNQDSEMNSKWSIGGRVSPVYSYRNLSGDAFKTPDESVDAGYFDSNEEGITTIAGGISLDYQFNKRLSLGSGMYLSRIGQQNNDVLAYNDSQTADMFKLATSSGTVTINPGKFESVIAEQAASAKDSIPGDYTVSGSFVQNLDYLEVPLVLKYKVIDKKFSVNVLGGLSPGVLVNNRSYFSAEGQKLQTGTTENIEPFIYNSVVGLGLEYAISRKLAFSMEPSFKYSLSPVNSGSDLRYHPYSLSVFTGISYRLD